VLKTTKIYSSLKEAISVGDVMAHFYGNQARILTGIAVFTTCILFVSVQVLGIGYLLQYVLEISPNTAMAMGCGLIVACSALDRRSNRYCSNDHVGSHHTYVV
jgi:Na+/proline symporter